MKEHNLLLGPAERADVIVDFSQFAGKTLILYNDAPAPVPAGDPRVDYYTGDPGLHRRSAARPRRSPAIGPNTRTIMQIKVANTTPAAAFDPAKLDAAFASTATTQGVFAESQDPIIVPQAGYNSAYNGNFPSDGHAYARIQATGMTFTPAERPRARSRMTFKTEGHPGVFSNIDGRMSGVLGVELPFTNGQTPDDHRLHGTGPRHRDPQELDHADRHRPATAPRSGRSRTTASTRTPSTSTCSTCRWSTASTGPAS